MVDGSTMQAILYDISAGRSVEHSKLVYTAEMLEFRAKSEAEWKAFKLANPDAVLYVPAELPYD